MNLKFEIIEFKIKIPEWKKQAYVIYFQFKDNFSMFKLNFFKPKLYRNCMK